MNMQIVGPAMVFKFEMMMFDVLKAMAHLFLAGFNGLGPESLSIAFDAAFTGDRIELGVYDKLRAD